MILGKKATNSYKIYSKIEPKHLNVSSDWDRLEHKIVLIGTSTGGPSALQMVLTQLPADINAPIVIVQHMPAGFTKSLASRLNTLSKINVKEAEDGEFLEKGTAYIAPGGGHLKVRPVGKRAAIQLYTTEQSCVYCPSVNILFQSAVDLREYGKVVVIMTGMGNDGADGLTSLKRTGHVKTIVQSEETCVVFGMPKAAISTNCVDNIENVDHIAETIVKYL
jgi:two-component system chemotaxis response regulator CheB